jgi:hypothetical protein
MSWLDAATWCQIKGGDLITIDSQSVVLMIDWYKITIGAHIGILMIS